MSMDEQPKALLVYGFDLGDPLNGWKVTGLPLSDDEPTDVADLIDERLRDLVGNRIQPGEYPPDAIRRVLGVELVSHAYNWDGCALIAAGRRYEAGYGKSVQVDPAALAVVSATEAARVADVLTRLGLILIEQSNGPGWQLLVRSG
ncbi:hypothetical protein [Actinoplanes sp. NPDC051859]|uniref:hypothetical protein n=1 Tax=Actinoplanes sp. NPDC051859 TaxID=3363909 RepID=UPI0037BDA10A